MQAILPLMAVWIALLVCVRAQADCDGDIVTEASVVPEMLLATLNWRYGDKGFEWSSRRGDTELWIGLRFQTRVDSFSGDLTTVEDLLREGGKTFDLRRGRLKGGGNLFWEWFELYSEYDWRSNTLLDYRATATYDTWLKFRVGQWKSEYNRERVDSSGKQQLVERSLSNYWFTIDRQRGIAVSPRLAEGSILDTTVWIEYLSGQGRGGNLEDGIGLWLTRWQWNPAGEQLAFSQSDLQRRASPVPSLAFATVVGRTPFTRFSSSGGGSLPGFDRGDFNLEQFLIETAWHYRGIAWQQELHWKNVEDRANGETTRLVGGYAQIGSFLNEWWSAVPASLELVGRLSIVDPDQSLQDNTEREWTLGANWFINGHRNKFTSDVSWLVFDSPDREASQVRFRLQWELSL